MNQPELFTALGPLAELYADVDVLEIMVDAPDKVYVERQGVLLDTAVTFPSTIALQNSIHNLLALGHQSLSPERTTAETRLPDGSRIVVVLPPTAVAGPHLVIRKFPGLGITWEKLLAWQSITPDALNLLQAAIRARQTLLIAGGTAAGKTTVANLLAGSIPADQRVILVEATYEMRVHHPRCLALEAGGPANIRIPDLLDTAARMRPDWLIIGELLGGEALHALEILGRGHSGMMTLHADSAENALTRLENMCLMANLGLGLGQIRQIIAAAVRLITYQELMVGNGRKRRLISQIVELVGVEHDRYLLQPLFRYNPDTDTLEATGHQPRLVQP